MQGTGYLSCVLIVIRPMRNLKYFNTIDEVTMSIHSIQQHPGVICRRLRMRLHDKRAPCCEGTIGAWGVMKEAPKGVRMALI